METILLILPFAFLILGVALGPLFFPRFWHHNYGKLSLAAAATTYVLYTLTHTVDKANYHVAHVMFKEYIPFMVLAFGLFTVTGGIRVHLKANPSPALNTLILGIGAVGANLFGTAGISMLLIRPFLKLNYNRANRMHQVIFFIFIVSNCGGCITPLGDPPLFLGFLNGVDFFWTAKYLFWPWLITNGFLLMLFYAVDSYKCLPEFKPFKASDIKFSIEGSHQFLLLGGIISAILLSGFWKPGVSYMVIGNKLELQTLVRDGLILSMALLSILTTPMKFRHAHEFTWEPIREVAEIFIGLFVTLFPIIEMLQGAAPTFKQFMTSDLYFWLTGLFSAFLDNAPTYLLFFNLSGGDPTWLMTTGYKTLIAISLGSVFMGALTYIGNAPNFMVRSIAKNYQMEMPSFLGYMVWSFGILIPVYALVDWLFVH